MRNTLSLSSVLTCTTNWPCHCSIMQVSKVADSVTIAYNEYHPYFFVWRGTQIMVEYTLSPEKGVLSQMAWDWEIIKPFFDHYSLTPTWVNCNYTWGWLDEETGTWTGAVGKVRNCSLVNRSIRSHFCNFEFWVSLAIPDPDLSFIWPWAWHFRSDWEEWSRLGCIQFCLLLWL